LQCAVKGLDLRSPKLERAGAVLRIAAESDLGRSFGEHANDSGVGDVAHLVVIEYGLAAFVAGHIADFDIGIVDDNTSGKWESNTGVVVLTN
jgi:hypothetical protein